MDLKKSPDVSLEELERSKDRHYGNEYTCSRECSWCYLESKKYFGYDPDIYYNAYYNYRKDRIPDKKLNIYRKSYFYRTEEFDRYYNNVIVDMRKEKINKLKYVFQSR
jgi:hypothetical protein